MNETVSAIPDLHHRLLVMMAIEEGREARRKLQLASASIPKLWAIDLDAVVAGNATPQASVGSSDELTDRLALRRLVSKLTNNVELAEFNLTYDGHRIKMRAGTGAALIARDELALLRTLARLNL